MRNETRKRFSQYLDRIAELNGVAPEIVHDAKKFTVAPQVQQTLENKIQESSEFLNRINVVPVPDMEGELLGLGVGNPVASRTDTSGNDTRKTTDPSGMDDRRFSLVQTNFDTHLRYAKIDLWAKFKDFQTRITNMVAQRCALDRIMVGWNGINRAATTDPVANPMRQDVNKGWLQRQREQNPTRWFKEGAKVAGKILVGPGGDYATLDALVYDAMHSFLPTWSRQRTDHVAICGDGLLHDKYMPLINREDDPSEQIARDIIMSSKRLGGKQAAEVPYMVDGAIFISPLSNLSIYYQEDKRRRHIKDVPERDRIEDYQSSNEDYVIEELDHALLIENIEIVTADA